MSSTVAASPVGVLLEPWTPPAQCVYHEPLRDLQSQSGEGGRGAVRKGRSEPLEQLSAKGRQMEAKDKAQLLNY